MNRKHQQANKQTNKQTNKHTNKQTKYNSIKPQVALLSKQEKTLLKDFAKTNMLARFSSSQL